MQKYKVFIRSARNWQQFAQGRKRTIETGLTYDEAKRCCQNYNAARTSSQIRKGTMAEFTAE